MEPEERKLNGIVDPMCEVFPKMAACRYHRYGMGGREDNRHAICILGLNMINDKVFVIVWIWHVFIVVVGTVRIFTRSGQLVSARVRYILIKQMMNRYLKNNAHVKHIQHYIIHCSLGKYIQFSTVFENSPKMSPVSGDWFVLYQMSKNLNRRFFAEFITVLALTVNPDPNIEPEEPEIYLTEADLERRRNGRGSKSSSRKSSISSGSGSGSGSGSDDDDDDDNNRRKGNPLMRCEGDIDTDIGAGGAGASLSGKQRMLIKQGKGAMGAKHNAMKSQAVLKRLRSRR